VEQGEVFNEAKGIYEYSLGDNSMLFLLYGVITILITLSFICFMMGSVRCAYQAQVDSRAGKKLPGILQDVKSLFDYNIHKFLLTWPMLGLIIFTVTPLIFMVTIAFTNYDRNHQPPGQLFDWVGFANFSDILGLGGSSQLSNTFWPVLIWTLVWAFFATFSNYILGMLLAILINRKGTRLKGMWRFFFMLSIAMPAFITLLTMRTVFHNNGAFNILLRALNILGPLETISYFGDPLLSKITVIMVNIWIGVPFTLLITTGILKNIPEELYEAAEVDGANKFVTFFKITLPYMIFITTPYLITQFTGNINNFNVIFFLTNGEPLTLDYYIAGKTDLLITWLYKLTITNKDYNLGSVIGILSFVLMAVCSLLTYRFTGSYKDEEAFQK
jgi:arabinogalactan oligomer/maltooligosaccharide transport system permease protein